MTYPRTRYAPAPVRPASAGQLEWIEKKLTEHAATHTRESMATLTGYAFDELTTKTAGTWLDILFGLPPVARVGAATEEGTYARDGRLYRAQRTQDGQRIYLKTWDAETGKWAYDPDGLKFGSLNADEFVTAADALALYGVDVAPKARKAGARRGRPPVTRAGAGGYYKSARAAEHQSLDRSIDETPAQYNTRTGQGVPPGFATGENTHDDADLLSHFGIN